MRETLHQQFSYIFLESIPFRVYYTFAQGNLLKHNLQGKTYLGRKMAAILNFPRYFKQLEFDFFCFTRIPLNLKLFWGGAYSPPPPLEPRLC